MVDEEEKTGPLGAQDLLRMLRAPKEDRREGSHGDKEDMMSVT